MDLLKEILSYYKIDYETYLRLSKIYTFDNFNDGHEFDNGYEAANYLLKQINEHKKIIIYGDYDADGILGISILKKMFMYLNYDVDYYAPSRYIDGYGITLNKAQEYIQNKYDLVITVDNGITAFEPIKLLRDNNIDVIVIDHHTPEEVLPMANYILHPMLSHLGDVASSGAFSAFMFSKYVLNRVDKYLATLAAISIITDIMPLLEYNHNLLKAAINSYVPNEFLALSLLFDNSPLSVETIGMKVGPRINSIGRMIEDESINDLVKYLVTDDKNFILNYIEYILEINETRKSLTNIDLDKENIDRSKSGIVYKINAKEGLIGLYANSIVKQLNRPAVVFTKSKDDGILKGSARTAEPFKIDEAFDLLRDLLITGGGHPGAGGCSIKESDYDSFSQRFNELASKYNYTKSNSKFIEISLSDLNRTNAEIINSIGPFGKDYEAPLFKISHIKSSTLSFSRNNENIMTYVSKNTKLLGWGISRNIVNEYDLIDIYGTINISSYKGLVETQFLIKSFEEHK